MNSPRPARRRWRQHVIATLVIAVLGGAGAYVWVLTTQAPEANNDKAGGPGKRGGNRVQPVLVAEAKETAMPQWLQAIGTVLARQQVTVRSRVDGTLIKVAFKEGQQVKEGDLLAEIDPRPFQIQLTQTSGQLTRDQALLQNAELDLKRYRELWAKDAIAKQQLDTQEALVRQYQGTVESDKGLVDNAKLQLSYARIVAPMSGRIGLRQVDPGNLVRASDANGLANIAQLQPITVIFALPENHLPGINKRLAAGQTLQVEAWDREQKNLLASGQLITTDNQIDTSTGTIKLKAEFTNKDGALFPNQFVNARLLLGTQENAIVVPVAAVQRGARGSFVYTVDAESTVAILPVFPGASDGKLIAVGGDLKAGDKVVIDGTDRLRPGAKVEIITAEQRAALTAPPGAGTKGGENKGGDKVAEKPAEKPADKTPAAPKPAAPGENKPKATDTLAPAPTSASANPWGEGEKPRWWDKVPPEIRDKLMQMSPEERREWLIKRREERERQAAGQ